MLRFDNDSLLLYHNLILHVILYNYCIIYSTLYTGMKTCFIKINIHEFDICIILIDSFIIWI